MRTRNEVHEDLRRIFNPEEYYIIGPIVDKMAVFPKMSFSMIAQAIQQKSSAHIWKPLIERLVEADIAKRFYRQIHNASGRISTVQWLELANDYQYEPLWVDLQEEANIKDEQ